MDPELSILAATAAATFIGSLTTDAWDQAKDLLLGFWLRIWPAHPETAEDGLVRVRDELLAARKAGDERTEDALVSYWSSRINILLTSDPRLETDLRRIVSRLSEAPPREGSSAGGIQMNATAKDGSRIYQAGRDQHINDR